LRRAKFCSVSGDLPGPHCTDLVEGWFIPGVSPIKPCTIHREVLVDVATGLRLPLDDGTREIRHEVYEFWPGNLLSLFQRAGVARRLSPPFLPGTPAEFAARSGNPPRIISPSHESEILLASANSIPLRTKADADVRDIYWFAGKTFLGKCSAAEVLSWKSAPGDYELTALDDHGRSASCKVKVR
jgi:penicillin-binding protein 1C